MNVKKIKVQCLNCGIEYKTKITNIQEDKFGKYIICENCESSFNIKEE